MNVEQAVAFVTGGAQGLGLAIAQRLLEGGARVVVVDRNEEALAKLASNFESILIDITDPLAVKIAVDTTVARLGRIDILVNNAGVISSEPLVNILNPSSVMDRYERFRSSIKLNLDSVFIVTASVVEHMIGLRVKGVIINISSISACGNEGQTAYSAAKAGVNAMTVTWAKELGRWGIRANAVAPGFIDSNSTHQALNEDVLKHLRNSTPLNRLGCDFEVAQAVTALIENDFITGAILDVNGGLRL